MMLWLFLLEFPGWYAEIVVAAEEGVAVDVAVAIDGDLAAGGFSVGAIEGGEGDDGGGAVENFEDGSVAVGAVVGGGAVEISLSIHGDAGGGVCAVGFVKYGGDD